jgi:hypothetical protein
MIMIMIMIIDNNNGNMSHVDDVVHVTRESNKQQAAARRRWRRSRRGVPASRASPGIVLLVLQ